MSYHKEVMGLLDGFCKRKRMERMERMAQEVARNENDEEAKGRTETTRYYQSVDCRENGTGLYGFCKSCGMTVNGPHCRPGGYQVEPTSDKESGLFCLSCLDEMGAERLPEPDPAYETEVARLLADWRALPD